MANLVIVGIDLGTNLAATRIELEPGAAMSVDNIRIIEPADLTVYLSLYDEPGRWIGMGHYLDEHVSDATSIFYERVVSAVHTGGDASQIYGGFNAVLLYWAHHNGIPCQGVSVQAAKKALTMDPGASKAKMLKFARAMSSEVSTYDQADSLGVALAGLQLIKNC